MTRRKRTRPEEWMRFIKQMAFLAVIGFFALILVGCWAIIQLVQLAAQQ